MKKLSAILIIIVMLFSTMPVSAATLDVTKIKKPTPSKPTTVVSTPDTTTTTDTTTTDTTTTDTTPDTTTTDTTTTDSENVNVKDFGAKGDGVTDDTTAIQNAIDTASANGKTVVFPASSSNYLIQNTVYLKSNITISGYGATIYMPSQDSPKIMLTSRGTTYINNVNIEGISLKSVNDRAGTNYEVNSMTSNVQAIYIQGISNLTIKDVRMDNMYNGLKFNASDDGTPNKNVNMDNLQIYNSRTPVYADGTVGFYMNDSVLDANGGATHWLHCVYISADTDDFVFDNVTFQNSPGGGVTIGSSYPEREDPKNITVKNSTIENCNRGFNIYGASNATSYNTEITRCNLGFAIHDGTNIDLSDININKATQTVSLSGSDNKGAFELSETYDSTFSNITIDSAGMAGSLFNLEDQVQNLTLTGLNVTNMEDIRFFETSSSSINNLIVENSRFEWSSISDRRINFRTAGSDAIFRNNIFVNNGSIFDSLAYNESGTNISLEGNSYSGFTTLEYIEEFSIVTNNLNLDTNMVA